MAEYSKPWLVTAAALMALAGLQGCMQTVGDLGRPSPGLIPERAYFAPANGALALNETDEEREMHDRVWRFLRAPQVNGWFFETLATARPGTKPADVQFERSCYYRYLHNRTYQSSRVRFNKVGDDVAADLGTLPDTFRAICAVNEIDRGRSVALDGLGGIEADMADGVAARQAANAAHIDKFATAVRFRYDAYSYALDHLLVETPHEEAIKVDGLLNELAVYAGRADGGRFCDEGVQLSAPRVAAIPSRASLDPIVLEPVDLEPDRPY